MDLPKPKNWQEFEDIVRDAQAQQWKSPNLQKNGRSGQKQHGVDIYGPDDIGRRVGIQCKRYTGVLDLATVATEVENAEKFEGNLSTLFIATTAQNDAKLQQDVRILSDKRVSSEKFAVGLLFWDDIVGGLLLNPSVFSAHYPQLQLPKHTTIEKESLIAALELGYYGAHLWKFVMLIYGEFGWLANVDPDELNVILRIVEQRASQLLPPDDFVELQKCIAEVRTGSVSPKQESADWNPIEMHAKRIENRVRYASSLLPVEVANALKLGEALGRVYHHIEELPTATTITEIKRQVRAILPKSCSSNIDKSFASAAKTTAGYDWAPIIFGLLDREIRWL